MFRSAFILSGLLVPAIAAAAPMSADTYVAKAGAGDLYEITSSRLVSSSTNAKIRAFAAMMIKDHTDSTAQVKAAAAKAGVKVMPPKLDAAQSKMIADLRATTGVARDRLYVDQQKKAHQMALTLHQDYAMSGTAAPLKLTAGKIAPVVKQHIGTLAAM